MPLLVGVNEMMKQKSQLLQTELCLHLRRHVGRQCGADVGDAASEVHDVDITARLAYLLDGIENLGGDSLHLLRLLLGESLLVVLIALLNLLVHVLQLLLAALLDVGGQRSLLLLVSL